MKSMVHENSEISYVSILYSYPTSLLGQYCYIHIFWHIPIFLYNIWNTVTQEIQDPVLTNYPLKAYTHSCNPTLPISPSSKLS